MTPPVLILHADDEKIIFQVQASHPGDEPYTVTWDFDNGWLCTCHGCLKGHHLCKHILAAEEYMKFLSMSLLDDPSVFSAGVV